ncbi:MAG TPA: potassium-transporting ATPase subunit KdpA [Solirubrobacteraceae bacterium]|nr:potassium-transporting ATPase subunit KdpA [Solirubrobacteraceae bacterium]
MTLTGWIQIVVLVAVLTGLTPLLGGYMARVYQGDRVALTALVSPIERAFYRIFRVDRDEEHGWKEYARSLLLFSAASWLVLYVVLRTQAIQPFNPQGFTHSGPWDLSFNTASSFVSNTSWQFYAGETTLSDFAQMAGITVASFTSMATGMAVAAAMIRGLARRGSDRLGNFWVDLTRSLLYVVMPIAFVASIVLVATGVPQTLEHYLNARGPTGLRQTIAIGPVASQEAIKLMSGDGGGFFNTNSAHPFENPNGVSNLIEILLMLLVPAAFTATFGRMIGRRRQGWALYAAMLVMFIGGTVVLYAAEAHGTPAQHAAGLHHVVNMEGKEQRFGTAGSALFVDAGTASGDGAVNSGVESYTGLGGAVAMSNMMTGEVIFGGPGSGLYGMLLLVVLAVFIAGLMVGRTPEYLGKQIQAREVKLASIGSLFVPFLVLVSVALAVTLHAGRQSMSTGGPQGMAESVYAYLSQAQNNGSAFAGYGGFVQPVAGNVGSHGIAYADIAGGWVMMLGRFVPILAALALAGSLGPRRIAPPGLGTLRTDTPTFVVFLIGFVAIFAVLTFLTVLILAPFAQALTPHLFG